MNSKTLATLAALTLATAIADTGCLAPSDDADEITDAQEELANVADDQAAEKTGEADQAFLGGWGGFWGGFGGWGGCGGCGLWGGFGGFGGCGFGGFGGCGLGFGGFGGCGLGFGGCGLGFGGCW